MEMVTLPKTWECCEQLQCCETVLESKAEVLHRPIVALMHRPL
jgi:hypothetical protein